MAEVVAKRPKPITSRNKELHKAYRRGANYLRKREFAAGLGNRQPKAMSPLPYGQRCRFAIDDVGKHIAFQLAEKYLVDENSMRSYAKFAEAVETIVTNCGISAMAAIFDSGHPQTVNAITELSRTSIDRQQYRVAGVLAGRFKSLKIAGDDPVFDTVSFSEVPSRLRRARGAMLKCLELLDGLNAAAIATECGELAELCRSAALELRQFLRTHRDQIVTLPESLRRERVQSVLARREVEGSIVGHARAALKLTVKNVWDFPEIQRRRIMPSPLQIDQTYSELQMIIAVSETVLATNVTTLSNSRSKTRTAS